MSHLGRPPAQRIRQVLEAHLQRGGFDLANKLRQDFKHDFAERHSLKEELEEMFEDFEKKKALGHVWKQFAHNPQDYAKAGHFPTLVIYGEKDASVSGGEIDNIMQNFNGNKLLKTYSEAGHDNYLQRYKNEWTNDVSGFLTTIGTPQ